jgi:uncharacterized protein YdaU (DUF1376 family)
MVNTSYMPFYTSEYLLETRHLSLAEHGAYILLLATYWQNGGELPYDEKYLTAICGGSRRGTINCIRSVLTYFQIVDTPNGKKLRHPRLDKMILKYRETCAKRSESGKIGLQKRWGKSDSNPIANAMPDAIANGMANGIANNKYININTTQSKRNTTELSTRTRALDANPDSAVQQALTGGEPSIRQELVACLEKYFPNLEYQLRSNPKFRYMLDKWEGAGVVPDDIDAAVSHVRETRPGQPVTSPMYYAEVVLRFTAAREEEGSYDAARWGNFKRTHRDILDETVKEIMRERELEKCKQ